jgi:hypothetical protein
VRNQLARNRDESGDSRAISPQHRLAFRRSSAPSPGKASSRVGAASARDPGGGDGDHACVKSAERRGAEGGGGGMEEKGGREAGVAARRRGLLASIELPARGERRSYALQRVGMCRTWTQANNCIRHFCFVSDEQVRGAFASLNSWRDSWALFNTIQFNLQRTFPNFCILVRERAFEDSHSNCC